MGNPLALMLGPGKLKYSSSLSTPEPTDLASAWNAGFIEPGYTDDGSKFTLETNFEDVEVAEELEPVLIAATKRTVTIEWSMAEITASNLRRVLNGGTITSGGAYVYYDPPALGAEQYCMLGWESDDGTERWIFRKCIQTGPVAINRQKSPNKALFTVQFRAVKPPSLGSFRAIYASPGRA